MNMIKITACCILQLNVKKIKSSKMRGDQACSRPFKMLLSFEAFCLQFWPFDAFSPLSHQVFFVLSKFQDFFVRCFVLRHFVVRLYVVRRFVYAPIGNISLGLYTLLETFCRISLYVTKDAIAKLFVTKGLVKQMEMVEN